MTDTKDLETIVEVDLDKEMRTSYLDYAMSVIVSRALPDVRDGLKPVHRRIIYGMSELGLYPDRPYRKSARLVGDVMGKFHPHGDSAIYDAVVRLAQDFSTRYPLADGQGNFGSMDGDGAAAMRYTEIRMTKLALEMLRDINKDTVDFQPNFDESEKEPTVLPSRYPNLLVNGSSGIAVGMATNMAPHNLGEVINGVLAYIDDPEITIDELSKHIKGPDFPTGGMIMGKAAIKEAYNTGRGKVMLRAVVDIEERKNGRYAIIVRELPYQVNKSALIMKIAHKELTVANIEQFYFEVRSNMKTEILSRLLDIQNPKLTIVFCNTKKMVDELTSQLQARGYFADGLHGDLKQTSRDVVMRKFREGTIDILVATDVAARGIYVDDVDMVVNYDLPQDEENYVHRIGRTARAGRTGAAYSFVVGRDIYKLKDIMRYSKANIKRLEVPKLEELRTLHNEMLIEEIKTIIDDEQQVKFKNVVDSLMLQDYSSVDIAAALLFKASTSSKLGMHEELDMIDNSKRIEKRTRKERGDREFRDGRDSRDNRRQKEDFSKAKTSISRVFISLGKKDNISPRHLLTLLENSTDLPKGSIKDIDIYDSFSFADVKTEITQDLINAVDGTLFKGKPIRIERAARSKGKRK